VRLLPVRQRLGGQASSTVRVVHVGDELHCRPIQERLCRGRGGRGSTLAQAGRAIPGFSSCDKNVGQETKKYV